MDKLKKIYEKITDITDEIGNDHVGAYAAQSAYFFMLCMIPIILLLLTLVQYTPVTKADVMTAVMQVFPVFRGLHDGYGGKPGVQSVHGDHPGYDHCGSVVGRKRRSGHDNGAELCIPLQRDP